GRWRPPPPCRHAPRHRPLPRRTLVLLSRTHRRAVCPSRPLTPRSPHAAVLQVTTAASLVVAQGGERAQPHGAARRQGRGQQGDEGEEGRRGAKREGVAGADLEEEALQGLAGDERQRQAGGGTNGHDAEGLAKDEAGDSGAGGAEGDADTKFARAADDSKGDEAVKADGG